MIAGSILTRVHAWPTPARLLLRLALTAALVRPAMVLGNWLAIGTITEAWPWFLWGEDYLHLAEQFFFRWRPALIGALVVVSWWGLGKLLMPRAPRPGPLWKRVLRGLVRLPMALVVLGAAGALAGPAAVNSVRFVRTFPPRTNAVVMENCGHCHSPYRPQHFVRTEAAWRRTVQRMRERNGADKYVDEQTAEEVIRWLSDYRGFSDGWMFRAKCLRCHGEHHLREQERTAEEWAWVVERVAWLSPFAFREDQREQLRRHLATDLSAPAPAPGTPEAAALADRMKLQDSCNPCHSISLVLEDGALDDTEAMVRRMSSKDPSLVPPDEIDEYVRIIDGLPRDRAGLGRLFPHDELLELE